MQKGWVSASSSSSACAPAFLSSCRNFFGFRLSASWHSNTATPRHLVVRGARRRSFSAAPLDISKRLRFVSGVSSVPHPKKKATNGEDSHFVSICGRAVGVSDGVGGWAELGIDAGEYSRELCFNMNKYVSASSREAGALTPQATLAAAYKETTSMGTATACVITIDGSTLNAANLGDSGFMLLRKDDSGTGEWRMLYQTTEQQHYFNCPKQLGTKSNDRPSDAQLLSLPVLAGDMVIAATDGFFDNVFPEDVCRVINAKRRGSSGWIGSSDPKKNSLPDDIHVAGIDELTCALERLAGRLSGFASKAGKSETRRTPFAVSAGKAGYFFEGGKIDDITIVTSIAVDDAAYE